MAEPGKDRRVQRTRLMLRSAMVALIREKGFEALTVQDIIDRANVGRSTFYSHFKSKEDLLTGSVQMMRSSMRQFQRRAIAASTSAEDRLFAFSGELFAHAEEHRDVFAAMVGKRSGTLFQQHLHRMVADLVREDVTAVTPGKKRGSAQMEAVVQFVSGGLLGLIVMWLEEMTDVAAADMNARFRKMAIACVQAGLA